MMKEQTNLRNGSLSNGRCRLRSVNKPENMRNLIWNEKSVLFTKILSAFKAIRKSFMKFCVKTTRSRSPEALQAVCVI